MARTPKPDGRSSKAKKSRGRTNASYNRVSRLYEPAKKVLIVCEGSKTEPGYFEKLKHYLRLASVEPRPIDVVVEGEGFQSAPLAVVRYAIGLRDERNKEIRRGATNESRFDEIWCVFDTESEPFSESFLAAVELAKKNRFHLVVSNPAFEFWYLVHYELTTRSFLDADEVIQQLKRYVPEYEKRSVPENGLFARLPTAIANSEGVKDQLAEVYRGDFPNPSTSVEKIVKSLIKMVENAAERRSR